MRSIGSHRLYLTAFILGVAILFSSSYLVNEYVLRERTKAQSSFEIVNAYPHDPKAFTQGLVYSDGFLYEGTGLYGQSSLRRVELRTGKILQMHSLTEDLFGEGITIFRDEIIQLTWLEHKGFVYDKKTFKPIREFSYPIESWGLTSNGTHLIMSDGTANLYFLNPETFKIVRSVEVRNSTPVIGLNELEYIKGEIYANVWRGRFILRIDPENGRVKSSIDLNELVDYDKLGPEDVLNGIAYNPEDDLLYVTGKRWPKIFEIRLGNQTTY